MDRNVKRILNGMMHKSNASHTKTVRSAHKGHKVGLITRAKMKIGHARTKIMGKKKK